MAAASVRPQRRLLIALSIAAVLLLAATIVFGTMLTSLVQSRATTGGAPPTGAPTPTASATPSPEPATVHGIPITVGDTALEFGTWVTGAWEDGETQLHAPIRNSSTTQAVTVFYDLTAYDAEGRILDRVLAIANLLPESEGILDSSTLRADADKVASFVVEQTDIRADVPPYSGTVTPGEVDVDPESGRVSASLTSTLSPNPDRQEIQLAVFLDDEMIGLCSSAADADGKLLTGECYLRPTSSGTSDFEEDYYDVLPEDIEVRAFLQVEFDLG